MMTAVLNPFPDYTKAQIRASRSHALLTHTTEFNVCRNGDSFEAKRSKSSTSACYRNGTGAKAVEVTREQEPRVEYCTFDCASSARVSVGARRLAQARRAVRRSGRASERFHRADIATARRALRPICIATNERGHASECRAGGRRAPSCTHSTKYPTQPVICWPESYFVSKARNNFFVKHSVIIYSLSLLNL